MFGKESSYSFSVLDPSVEVICEKLICKNIDILGNFSGSIQAQNIFVKNNGALKGSILCHQNLKMEKGLVEGDIVAEYIYLYKGAVLRGKIRYVNLHIEEGAIIESNDIKKVSQEDIDVFFKEDNTVSNAI
jgi:cytoskeletal protein CcmA (bactofilin family)